MRYFFLLWALLPLSAYADTYFECLLDDGTNISLSQNKKRWQYQSRWADTNEVLWQYQSDKKNLFRSARQLIIDKAHGSYTDNATIRFYHEGIHYILFNEYQQKEAVITQQSGLLVVRRNEQRKFQCKTIKTNRLYDALPYFECDAKMKNKHGSVCEIKK